MHSERCIYIGLISGTSVDAVDAGAFKFDESRLTLIGTLSFPYPPSVRERILSLCDLARTDLLTLGDLSIQIGQVFASAANALMKQESIQPTRVRAIGSHGQTVFHHPSIPNRFTIQLGDPSTIAMRTGIDTVADFRSMDMAYGGEGAPLAPLFHNRFFRSDSIDRVILNIGGIANITILEQGKPVIGFDTGPGNVLMDYWINTTCQLIYDDEGAFASSGEPEAGLLSQLLEDPYFSRPYPKSTGRELFNGNWLESHLRQFSGDIHIANVQATLLELSARTIVDAIERSIQPKEVLVCGGGAYNRKLLQRIQELMPRSRVDSTSILGLDPDWVEAATFAWLAHQRIQGVATDTGPITGASQPSILGGLYLATRAT